jgi:cyclase
MAMQTHRRGFLRQTLWTGACLLEQAVFRAAQARAQAASALPTVFDIEKVADGVYAALARPQALTNCNAAIFENAADILVVDTHSKPSAVASLVSQVRRDITKKPIRYVVNSHFHWDHTQGTPTYKRIAPHADVVASEATRRLLSENATARLNESVEQCRKSLDTYKQRLAAAKSPAEKTYYERMLQETREYISEMRNYTPELPNVTFDRDLILRDKAHDLHLAFLGRAHTAGDIVVWCPQKKVIASGDMLHGFGPFIADGYPLEWPRTLLHSAEFEFEHVIGGHGGVQHTRDRLYQMGNYIEEVTEAVVRGKRDNKSLSQLQQEVTPDKLKTVEDGGYGRFTAENQLKHRLNAPGTAVPQLIADMVKTNIEQIFTTLERG